MWVIGIKNVNLIKVYSFDNQEINILTGRKIAMLAPLKGQFFYNYKLLKSAGML